MGADSGCEPVMVAVWLLKRYEELARLAILVAKEEFQKIIAGQRSSVLESSQPEKAYALVSMFRDVIYMHPYFKKKSLRILNAIIHRVAEAYDEKDYNKLYIPENAVKDWLKGFEIDQSKKDEYLAPLKEFKILDVTNEPEYPYKVNDHFYRMFASAAQFLVTPRQIDTFVGAMSSIDGLVGLYVLAVAAENEEQNSWGPKIPRFIKLSTAYTVAGASSSVTPADEYPMPYKIDEVLKVKRINYVDDYFVVKNGEPAEVWRSVRTEAFKFMTRNRIIEGPDNEGCGYKLNSDWVRIHEEAIKRYVNISIKELKSRYVGGQYRTW